MRDYFFNTITKSWRLFKERAHGGYAKWWLAFIAFTESYILLIPSEALLIAILLAGSHRWIYYATFTTVFSVAGGVFGYIIGAFFFDAIGERIIDFYNLHQQFSSVGDMLIDNAFLVIFIAAFTPVPYKVFVLGAGFFKINFIIFFLASTLGRMLRFFLIAYLVKRFGERITLLVLRYFTIATIVALVLFALWFFVRFNF